MFCSKCGKEVHNDAIICPHCGCAIREKAVVKKKGESGTLAKLAMCFAFLSPIVGLILGIIGTNSYIDEDYRKKSKSAIFISLGIFVAVFTILSIVMLSSM